MLKTILLKNLKRNACLSFETQYQLEFIFMFEIEDFMVKS